MFSFVGFVFSIQHGDWSAPRLLRILISTDQHCSQNSGGDPLFVTWLEVFCFSVFRLSRKVCVPSIPLLLRHEPTVVVETVGMFIVLFVEWSRDETFPWDWLSDTSDDFVLKLFSAMPLVLLVLS